jgi:putative FmdB family regulatory protein
MPLYEYQCSSCDRRFERIEKASTTSTAICPDCGAEASRLLGVPALRFKGSGWYVTDYGTGNGSSAAADRDSCSTTSETSPAQAAKTTSDGGSKSDAKVA